MVSVERKVRSQDGIVTINGQAIDAKAVAAR
jgi:hypothetical protein